MFGDPFWDFLALLFKQYGLVAIIEVIQCVGIIYLFRLLNKKEAEKNELTEKLLELSEKRLEDAKEEREDYERLATNLNKSVDLLIKVFRQRNGEG